MRTHDLNDPPKASGKTDGISEVGSTEIRFMCVPSGEQHSALLSAGHGILRCHCNSHHICAF